jgi:hypothetical protein
LHTNGIPANVAGAQIILHELNSEAHAEARMAAEVLKEEEYFYRMPYAEEMRFRR